MKLSKTPIKLHSSRNSWWSDREGQTLLKFDQLTGDPFNAKIPAGAQIERANLVLSVKDDIDNPFRQ